MLLFGDYLAAAAALFGLQNLDFFNMFGVSLRCMEVVCENSMHCIKLKLTGSSPN